MIKKLNHGFMTIMKTRTYCAVVAGLLLVWPAQAADSREKAQTLKKFSTPDHTISKELTVTDEKTWMASCDKAKVIRLFEVPDPGVENCLVIYRAKIKTENLSEPAY